MAEAARDSPATLLLAVDEVTSHERLHLEVAAVRAGDDHFVFHPVPLERKLEDSGPLRRAQQWLERLKLDIACAHGTPGWESV